jgi:hypothetical protein
MSSEKLSKQPESKKQPESDFLTQRWKNMAKMGLVFGLGTAIAASGAAAAEQHNAHEDVGIIAASTLSPDVADAAMTIGDKVVILPQDIEDLERLDGRAGSSLKVKDSLVDMRERVHNTYSDAELAIAGLSLVPLSGGFAMAGKTPRSSKKPKSKRK